MKVSKEIDDFLGFNFDKEPETLTPQQLLWECKSLRSECFRLALELEKAKAEIQSKKKKTNTKGFLKDIGLKEWDVITIYRLALARLLYFGEPELLTFRDCEMDPETEEVTYLDTYSSMPNIYHPDNLAHEHSIPLKRPGFPYREELKESIHSVIEEKLGRKLTAKEYDAMSDKFLDDGYMRQKLREIFFKEPWEE
ncbi:hypothetical protein [Polynucleobacter sp. MWH-UH23A]|uniref:hypothetical protein n=1 Tax=Polynucleobacter sp. MWH-UH23A TaxID=1855613 RepID=UPI003364BA63